MFHTTRRARTWLAFAGFFVIVAFLLTTEHRAHVFGALPYLVLAACPLLHLFGHGGHGQHRDHQPPGGKDVD